MVSLTIPEDTVNVQVALELTSSTGWWFCLFRLLAFECSTMILLLPHVLASAEPMNDSNTTNDSEQ